MKYQEKKFSVYYTSKEYKNNWDKIFKKQQKKETAASLRKRLNFEPSDEEIQEKILQENLNNLELE